MASPDFELQTGFWCESGWCKKWCVTGGGTPPKRKGLYTIIKKTLFWVVIIGALVIVLEIIKESLPLGVFIFSILLSGLFIKYFLEGYTLKEKWAFKPDVLSLTFGIGVNTIILFISKVPSITDLSIYAYPMTWVKIAGITAIFSLVAYRYHRFGGKWINDFISTIVMAGLFLAISYVFINSLPDVLNFQGFSCEGIMCKVKFGVEKVFKAGILVLFSFILKGILNGLSKQKRYRHKSK